MNTGKLLTCGILLAVFFSALPGQIFAQQELSWDALDDLSYVEKEGKWGIEFGDEVKKLEEKNVKITGFMMPLESSLKQKHFILSMLPLDGCQFCAPGTQAEFIEISTGKNDGVEYTYNAITIEGTFELMPDAPMGVYFLIKNAKQVRE